MASIWRSCTRKSLIVRPIKLWAALLVDRSVLSGRVAIVRIVSCYRTVIVLRTSKGCPTFPLRNGDLHCKFSDYPIYSLPWRTSGGSLKLRFSSANKKTGLKRIKIRGEVLSGSQRHAPFYVSTGSSGGCVEGLQWKVSIVWSPYSDVSSEGNSSRRVSWRTGYLSESSVKNPHQKILSEEFPGWWTIFRRSFNKDVHQRYFTKKE